MARYRICSFIFWQKGFRIKKDGLVKSRKTDFLPQHIGAMRDDDPICCGQNKMLGLFTRPSRKAYLSYVKKGIDQGRRPELTGGGLVRSLGGWSMIKKLRLKGQDRIKGDERILGDSEFVTALLSEAKEKLERSYKLNALGYDLKKISQMVSKIYDIEIEEICC